MVTMNRLVQHRADIDGCLTRARGYLGTHQASEEELELLARIQALPPQVRDEELVEALIRVGDLQQCPPGYWEELSRVGHLFWRTFRVSQPPATRARQNRLLEELRTRRRLGPAAAGTEAGGGGM